MAEINVTTNEFKDVVLASDIPVLVDFWASWCSPCRMLAPFIGQIAVHYDGKIKVCKVNVDEEPEIARAHGIMNIPTLLVFKNGEVAGKMIGFHGKSEIVDFIEGLL